MTDEYRQQMQSGDSKIIVQTPPIVVQQLSSNIDPSKVYNQVDVSKIWDEIKQELI